MDKLEEVNREYPQEPRESSQEEEERRIPPAVHFAPTPEFVETSSPRTGDSVAKESGLSLPSSIAPTTPEKVLRWGGRLKTNLIEHDGDVRQYANDCIQVHGLKEAFDDSNGWARTWLYLLAFTAFGCFFVFLTVPLVKDYRNRTVFTSFTYEEHTSGVPLPILTVCPLGTGIRCDCLLWRRLHCRYHHEIRNYKWMARFDQFACWQSFDFDSLLGNEYPTWKEPNCEDFFLGSNTPMVDTCGPHESDENSGIDHETLFQRIVAREHTFAGPFLSFLELQQYAAYRLKDKVQFLIGRGEDLPDPVMEDWINWNYVEWSQLKRCAHLRIPLNDPNNLQQYAGSDHGIVVVGTDLDADDFPLRDMDKAVAGLDINANYVDEEFYNDTSLYVQTSEFHEIAAGFLTKMEMNVELYIRKQGWGSELSKNCRFGGIPRASCVQIQAAEETADACNCTQLGAAGHYYSILDCAANIGSEQHHCVAAKYQQTRDILSGKSFPNCPYRCQEIRVTSGERSSIRLSRAQIQYLRILKTQSTTEVTVNSDATLPERGIRRFGNATLETTLLAQFGARSLSTVTFEEVPSVPFGALLGSIGGNAGLWCGMSFSLIVELIEFGLMASLYGNGYIRRSGRAFIRQFRRKFWLASRRRGEHSERAP